MTNRAINPFDLLDAVDAQTEQQLLAGESKKPKKPVAPLLRLGPRRHRGRAQNQSTSFTFNNIIAPPAEAISPFLQIPAEVLQKIIAYMDARLVVLRWFLLTSQQMFLRLLRPSEAPSVDWRDWTLNVFTLDLSGLPRLVDSTRSLPHALQKFAAVTKLDLSDCPNFSNATLLSKLRHLKYLDISGCYALFKSWDNKYGWIQRSFHPNLATGLESLIFDNCDFSGPIVEFLRFATRLQVLSLRYCILSRRCFDTLPLQAPTLRHLDLSGARCTEVSFFFSGTKFTELEVFTAKAASLMKKDWQKLVAKFLTESPRLTELAIPCPVEPFYSEPYDFLTCKPHQNLQYLNLELRKLQPGFFKVLSQFPRLTELRIRLSIDESATELADLGLLQGLEVFHYSHQWPYQCLPGYFRQWSPVAVGNFSRGIGKLARLRKLSVFTAWDQAIFPPVGQWPNCCLEELTLRCASDYTPNFEWIRNLAGLPVRKLTLKVLRYPSDSRHLFFRIKELQEAISSLPNLNQFTFTEFRAPAKQAKLHWAWKRPPFTYNQVLEQDEAQILLQLVPQLREVSYNTTKPHRDRTFVDYDEYIETPETSDSDEEEVKVLAPVEFWDIPEKLRHLM